MLQNCEIKLHTKIFNFFYYYILNIVFYLTTNYILGLTFSAKMTQSTLRSSSTNFMMTTHIFRIPLSR